MKPTLSEQIRELVDEQASVEGASDEARPAVMKALRQKAEELGARLRRELPGRAVGRAQAMVDEGRYAELLELIGAGGVSSWRAHKGKLVETGIAVFAAALLSVIWLPALGRALASTGWSSAPGTVISAQVVEKRSSSTDLGGPGRSSSSSTRTSYHPYVRYRYTVNGNSYEGDRFWLSELGTSEHEAEDLIAELTPGGSVVVHFDPANPRNSVLQTGAGWRQWIGPAAALLAWLWALVAFGRLLYARSRAR